MSLLPGTRLGPYDIVGQLGAGGMGEVYKARDTKLDRLVAIKVLPPSLAEVPDLLARFEREAKAVAALNHPGILGIFDFGTADGITFAVMELLEGETLRERLRAGPVPLRKAVDWAWQMAQSLAAAHGKGIIHRDLKPENLWITPESRTKILDFGLAKQLPMGGQNAQSELPTQAFAATSMPGMLLGTVGYMSPEQVKGEPTDARSDIFSLGVVLYEMLSGRAPFKGDTPVQTLNAILEQEPPDLVVPRGDLIPALERIVLHCLEKHPDQRFQTARDLGFALNGLATTSGAGAAIAAKGIPSRRRNNLLVASVLLGGMALGGWWFHRQGAPSAPVKYTAITQREVLATEARFAAGGKSVVFSEAASPWSDPATYLASLEDPLKHRRLVDGPTSLAGLSSTEELAVIEKPSFLNGWPHYFYGNLSLGRLGQSEPRQVEEDISAMDWSPNGKTTAILRRLHPRGMTLECPPGKVLATTEGWYSALRFSPDGKRLAWAVHPEPGDDGGTFYTLELGSGQPAKAVGDTWSRANGLAWHPLTGELWVGGSDAYTGELAAYDRTGRKRTVMSFPYVAFLYDIDTKGRVLLGQGMIAIACSIVDADGKSNPLGGEFVQLMAATRDGRHFLLSDVSTWKDYTMEVHLQQRGRELPRILGRTGWERADFSADGSLAGLWINEGGQLKLRLFPVGGGTPKDLPLTPLAEVLHFEWDAKGRIWVLGRTKGSALGLYQVEAGKEPRRLPVTLPPDTLDFSIPPGTSDAVVAVRGQNLLRVPLDGGTTTTLGTSLTSLVIGPWPMENGDRFLGWEDSGQAFFLSRDSRPPVRVERVALADGKRTPYRTYQSPDATWGAPYTVVDGGRSLVAIRPRFTMQLFLAEGLR
jgi:hypothetical protein